MKYFVMLGSPGDGPLLLVNDTDGEGPELFGMARGYTVYEWDY